MTGTNALRIPHLAPRKRRSTETDGRSTRRGRQQIQAWDPGTRSLTRQSMTERGTKSQKEEQPIEEEEQ
jgi:hypothetical protein